MSGAIVCDLDGVIYRGTEGVPGAAAALEALELAGYDLVFCTNNSSRTPDQTAQRISGITEYQARGEQVISSAQAAATLLRAGTRAFVLGGEGIRSALVEVGVDVTTEWERADAVVAGIDLELSYGRLADATRAVRGGARLIATNTDATFPSENGLLPGAGSLIAALETATGSTAEIAGKPHAPMQKLIAERVTKSPVWVVGDRPETDLAMAEARGWHKVLVLSGVTSTADGVTPEPDMVLDSLADLPEALR